MSFDTEKFIIEMESRRAIWDLSSEDYGDRDVRRRIWKEITDKMCAESLSENEIKEFNKSLQQKWKNIRTSFSRELKRRTGNKSGSAALRKSPYVYFAQLQFLRETIANNTNQGDIEETGVAENTDDCIRVRNSSLIHKKKKKDEDHALVDVFNQSITVKEDPEKNQESDSDSQFMFSLIEDLKRIPEHRKLSVKMEIINVINKAQTVSSESHRSHFKEYRHGYKTQPDYGPETSSSGRKDTTERYNEAFLPIVTAVRLKF